jgi:repressor LexA
MEGEGIEDGDVLVVKRVFEESDIKNGKLVIAVLPNGKCVVKRIYFEGDKIVLRSSNARFKDLVFGPDEIRIDGIVKGLGWRELV